MMINQDIEKKWHDSYLEEIIIAYDDIIVKLETDSGVKKLLFKNYIAIDYVGQWDENVVETIYEEKYSDIIENALKKVRTNNNIIYKGGGKRDINAEWKCIVIKLIDGVCIRIVCNSVQYG